MSPFVHSQDILLASAEAGNVTLLSFLEISREECNNACASMRVAERVPHPLFPAEHCVLSKGRTTLNLEMLPVSFGTWELQSPYVLFTSPSPPRLAPSSSLMPCSGSVSDIYLFPPVECVLLSVVKITQVV